MIRDELKKVLPEEGVEFFDEAYNLAKSNGYSDVFSERVAFELVKTKLKSVDSGFVANSEDFVRSEIFVFELEPNNSEFLINDVNGEFVLEGVLASTKPNKDGRFFDEEGLRFIANQINEEGSTLPDVAHEVWKDLSANYVAELLSNEELKARLKEKKGVFKKIKAIVKNGKLWIKAILDKRYKNYKDKFKGLSIEAFGKNINNKIVNPIYLGFTFTNNPSIRDALISK